MKKLRQTNQTHADLKLALFLLGSFPALLLFTGCASIVNGTHQTVTFDSMPTGADIVVDNQIVGKTPQAITLKRRNDQIVEFRKAGYKTLMFPMSKNYSYTPMVLGDFILGGPFGTTTDVTDGAIYQYDPNAYNVTLVKENATSVEGETDLSPHDKAKNFIMVSYRQIMDDLQKGHGEYLASLLNMLKVPSNQKDSAIKKIRALSEAYTDIPDFADHVIDLYMK